MSDIEDLVRRIAANEAARVMREHEARHHRSAADTSIPAPKQDVYPDRCRATGSTGVRCTKPQGHGQRHQYLGTYVPPHTPPPDNGWRDVPAFTLGRYAMAVGSPVKVTGFKRGEGTGWVITRIQKKQGASGADLDQINVEVSKPGSHPRTVKATRLVYVRPTSKTGEQTRAAWQKRGL